MASLLRYILNLSAEQCSKVPSHEMYLSFLLTCLNIDQTFLNIDQTFFNIDQADGLSVFSEGI